jgi:hypothetical protein
MKRWLYAAVVLIALLLPLSAFGQSPIYAPTPEEIAWVDVEPGLVYGNYVFAGVKSKVKGKNARIWEIPPLRVHIMKVDLTRDDITVRSLRPLGRSKRLEEIATLFKEGGVDIRAALNGDYFDFTQAKKDPLGMHVSGGQLLWFPANTSSLIVDEENRAHMNRYTINQSLTGDDDFKVIISGANRQANREEAVLYSGYYLEETEAQGSCTGLHLTRTELEPMVNNELKLTVAKVFNARRAKKLAPLDLAMVVCGAAREKAQALKEGSTVTLSTRVTNFDNYVLEAISGGPRILRDGEIVKEMSQEGFSLALRLYIPRPHPRSAVGISKDGKTVYMMAAEGRMKRSGGVSADDAASILKAAGAEHAMLFDGGGSVALMGDDMFYNVPHKKRNRTARALANALAVVRRAGKSGDKEE